MYAAASRPGMPSPHRHSTSEPKAVEDHEAMLEKGHQRTSSARFTDPKDWSEKKKWVHILIGSSMAMATPLGSTIHAPALHQIADDFSTVLSTASLTVQAYVVGFSIGPFLFLPLSKVYGRLYIYHAANLLLLLGHIGCALAPGMGSLIAFRFLAGCAGACAITQGSGVIADIIEKEKRGRAVALMAFGTVWAPTVGPLVGGCVAERFSWRGCFWVLVFVVAFNAVITLLYMDETSTIHTACTYESHPTEGTMSPLLTRFTQEDSHPSQDYAKPLRQVLVDGLFAPFRLMRHPLFSAIAFLTALFYSIQIYLYTDIPATYKAEYDFKPSQTGLAFLGTGIGMTVGLLLFGLTSDRLMIILAGNGKRRPEHRLPLMLSSAVLVSVGLVVYSLTARTSIHWVFPILGNGLTGAGLYSLSMAASTYLIDLCPERAADSASLLAVIRFPIGAIVSASASTLVLLIGRTAIQAIFAVLALHAIPVLYVLYFHSTNIHTKYYSKLLDL
ncbi:major facilitator superfamily domain-containing protein [Pyrenochaeta sp. MPI-SDFR-AT-0127]|nr:major facilitator superfamily domain-containing protein [Pyrenochaeta sp. MPI-SDFR-AT-0127]